MNFPAFFAASCQVALLSVHVHVRKFSRYLVAVYSNNFFREESVVPLQDFPRTVSLELLCLARKLATGGPCVITLVITGYRCHMRCSGPLQLSVLPNNVFKGLL